MRRLGGLLFGVAALATFATFVTQGCVYAPKFDDGALHCSPQGTCPKGYVCVAAQDNTCWADSTGGSAGTGAAGTTGTAGTGAAGVGAAGTVGHTPSADNFPGHWLFQVDSTLTINCTDGSTNTKSIATDFVKVTKGTTTALQGSYYCDWNLTLNSPPTKTGIPAGQSCKSMSTDPKTKVVTTYTWHGVKFEFSTTNGLTADLQAEISTDYTTSAAESGSCTVKISGNLTNAGPP